MKLQQVKKIIIRKAENEAHRDYLFQTKVEALLVLFTQLILLVSFIFLWELAAQRGIINTFLTSRPSKVYQTIMQLYHNGQLFYHLRVTGIETGLSFILGTIIGTFIAIVLWWWKFLSKVLDPYLIVLNSLPKVALGPLFIIVFGLGFKSIIAMALSITVITTTIVVYSGFLNVDNNYLKLVKTFGASKLTSFIKVVLPASIPTIASALRVNLGLSWVGVIVGEFLTGRAGLGYLAIYGGQTYQMNLVITSVILLAICSALSYQLLIFVENKIRNRFS
ncbi:NitT/TauT family transport system permease protein [Anaerobranca californiensis DSM 14826]|uniref:NitT/TauT family transport system permease protein n=1 Tax=Anaerobranca californiensis DSM 14826 TaxID=1120989 RepID=A0A1M6NNY5_9FIRM|nr:ABC transporter permease [Anaerobranca californiensis]SHJ97405.1 NitT/TauT family transport system permease protein [Anaerobranca californiensis DSM 14826]